MMLQAKELRVNNYLYITEEQKIGKIIAIDSERTYKEYKGSIRLVFYYNQRYENDRGFWLCNLKPINLTEDILLNCGFKHKGNGFYEILGCFIELCNIGNEFYHCGFKGKSIGNIKYLHQLQNLYFVLIGKELEIQLSSIP